jgi:hypothetical protein
LAEAFQIDFFLLNNNEIDINQAIKSSKLFQRIITISKVAISQEDV